MELMQLSEERSIGTVTNSPRVDYSMFGKIANAKIAKEAWDILKLSYKCIDKAQKSKLQSL